MTQDFEYYVVFGAGDGSENLDWTIELTDKEISELKKVIKKGRDLSESVELNGLLGRAYSEIDEAETENMLEMEDEYAEECDENGESPFDCGYSLYVDFSLPDKELIKECLKENFEENNIDAVAEMVDNYDLHYEEDLMEYIKELCANHNIGPEIFFYSR